MANYIKATIESPTRCISKADTHRILDEFYRTEKRAGEVIINNGDKVIAERLALSYSTVKTVLQAEVQRFFEKHNKLVNDKENPYVF